MPDIEVQLGKCRYNPDTRTVTQPSGDTHVLGHVPADLLRLLYENSDRYVSSDELLKVIWNDKVIEKNTIVRTVHTVRKALGESEYIESRRHHGYRFSAEVSFISPKPAKKSPLIIVSAFVLLTVFSFLLFMFQEEPTPEVRFSRPEPLTTMLGQEIDGASYKDLLVFSSKPTGGGKWNLYAKQMDNDRYFRLTHGEFDDNRAVFSPSGRQVAFQRHDGKSCSIITGVFDRDSMSLKDQTTVYECLDELLSVSIAWKDEENLYLSYTNSLSSPYQVYLYNIPNRTTVTISEPPRSSQGDYYVTFSNQSQKLAFFRDVGDSRTEVWIHDPKKQESMAITSTPFVLFSAAWSPKGESLIIRTASGELSSININTGKIERSELLVNYPVYYPFNLGEGQLAYMRGALWINDVLTISIEDGVQQSSISSSFNDYLPTFSQNSSAIAFVSTRSGRPQVWLREKNGDTRQLTRFNENFRVEDIAISNDGSVVAYTIDTQVHLVDRNGKHLFSSDDSSIYKNPVFSQDGSKFYYSVNYRDRWQIESRALNDLDAPINHTEGYIVKPCENDDSCMYVIKFNDPKLYKFSKGKTTDLQIELADIQSQNQISIGKNTVYFVDISSGMPTLKKRVFEENNSTSVLNLPSRNFSLDLNSLTLYTSRVKESETMLEKISF